MKKYCSERRRIVTNSVFKAQSARRTAFHIQNHDFSSDGYSGSEMEFDKNSENGSTYMTDNDMSGSFENSDGEIGYY